MKLKLISKQLLTDNVWSFQFEPQHPLKWEAGQFIYVELRHREPDAEGTKRWFTVSAAPFEKHIQITTRVTSTTFKQALANVPVGGELELLDEPDGDFVWDESDKPRVFVAAGIGITPFRSMLAQRGHDQAPLDATLVYANRDATTAPFKAELDALAAANSGLKIHYVTGMVTAGGLAELLPDLNQSLVYVSGPEPMVETLGKTLREGGLPENQIKEDFFPNYTEQNF